YKIYSPRWHHRNPGLPMLLALEKGGYQSRRFTSMGHTQAGALLNSWRSPTFIRIGSVRIGNMADAARLSLLLGSYATGLRLIFSYCYADWCVRPCQTLAIRLRQTAHMYSDLFYSFTIGSVGAILFLLVDKYDEGPLAHLLKFLILFVAGVAILHKLQPYGLALF